MLLIAVQRYEVQAAHCEFLSLTRHLEEGLRACRPHATCERTMTHTSMQQTYAQDLQINLQQTQRAARVQRSRRCEPGGVIMQHRVRRQWWICAHSVPYIPVLPIHPRSPQSYASLNPTIWQTHRARWPGREAGGRCQSPTRSLRSPLRSLRVSDTTVPR